MKRAVYLIGLMLAYCQPVPAAETLSTALMSCRTQYESARAATN